MPYRYREEKDRQGVQSAKGVQKRSVSVCGGCIVVVVVEKS